MDVYFLIFVLKHGKAEIWSRRGKGSMAAMWPMNCPEGLRGLRALYNMEDPF